MHVLLTSLYDMRNFLRTGIMVFLLATLGMGGGGLLSPAMAQLPQLLPSTSKAPPASKEVNVPPVDPAKELASAQQRLVETRDAMVRLQGQLSRENLPTATRNDILKQFNLQQTLADRYAQQVDRLKQLQVLAQNIADARQQLAQWAPPAGSPPWPVTDGDKVRSDMLSYQSRIKQLVIESTAIGEQIVALAKQQQDAQTKLRQLQEKLGATDAANTAKLDQTGMGALASLRIEVALKSALLLRSDLDRQLKDRQRDLLELRLAYVEKTWAYFDGRFVLTPEILAVAKGDLQSLIDLDRDLEVKALNNEEAAMARLAKAQQQFDALSPDKTPADRIKRARAALDIAQANEITARTEVDRLRQMIEIGGYAQQVWDARAKVYEIPRPDAAVMADIAKRAQMARVRIEQARSFLLQNLNSQEQEAFDFREASLTTHDPLDRQVLHARLQAANTQADSARSILTALDKFDQFLQLLSNELGISENHQTWSQRLKGYWQRAVSLGQIAWNYELFSVDDSIIADGKEVKTTRSVTVGKSIGAIGILLFGFLMVSWLIRSAMGIAERRIGLKSSVATLIRRWLMVIATLTLIVLSFNLVQIPLSVFAFLGGALAIGIGFGTQNLLKNLMSGVMLLVERPIRIGDLVEVEGVRGRVTSIGIRFSTIHSADGVDTLIPNSELVEKKLTNWTFVTPDVRREIKVGVAYGSDPVQVKNLLQAAAREHPDVMHSPEPRVVLDDLADSALLFTLRFWIRLDQGLDGREIDSDLRCEILQKLAAAGIEVPFPQRDVNLKAAEPLSVRVES